MAVEVVTKDDLEEFRKRLLEDIRAIILAQENKVPAPMAEGYRTKDVRKIWVAP